MIEKGEVKPVMTKYKLNTIFIQYSLRERKKIEVLFL